MHLNQTGNQSMYNQQEVFRYPYHEHLSRHKRSTDDFFDDNNNIAMYIVVPILVLCYGGCASIYCCHKCREYLKENDPVQDLKTEIRKFKNFITGKKENLRSENFLKELEERPRPSSIQSFYLNEEISDTKGNRSNVSTPGLKYFHGYDQYDLVDLHRSNTDSSALSVRTESTFISTIVSNEEHPFEIRESNPESHIVSVHQSDDAIFMAPAAGTATFVKSVSLTTGNVKYSNLEPDLSKDKTLQQSINSKGVWAINSNACQSRENNSDAHFQSMRSESLDFESLDANALSDSNSFCSNGTTMDTSKAYENKNKTEALRSFLPDRSYRHEIPTVTDRSFSNSDPPAYSEIGHKSFSSNRPTYSINGKIRTSCSNDLSAHSNMDKELIVSNNRQDHESNMQSEENNAKYGLNNHNPTLVNLQTPYLSSKMSYVDVNSINSSQRGGSFSSSNTGIRNSINSRNSSLRHSFNHFDTKQNFNQKRIHANTNTDISSYRSTNGKHGRDNLAFNGEISLGKTINTAEKKATRQGKRPRDSRIVDYWR